MTKRILMACANYWTSPFQVGSHHIARGFLAAGCEVGFLSDPISPLHSFAGKTEALVERWDIHTSGGISDTVGKLWAYVPYAWATPHNKPILRSRFVSSHWTKWTTPSLKNLLDKKGFIDVDLLYIDSPAYVGLLDIVRPQRIVFRIADNSMGFGKSTPAMRENEKELANRADATLYTAKNLRKIVDEMNPRNPVYFPNGVNFAHFNLGNRERPKEYNGITQPIIVYVGAMDVWFDFALVNRLVASMPDVMFVLIGPDDLATVQLNPKENLRLLGRKKFSELPPYLHNADVGIIPFDVENYPSLVNSVNPLKLYEYMACGLPVVATRWDELNDISSGAILASGKTEFETAIRAALEETPLSKERIAYAEKQDWSRKVLELLKL